MPLQYLRIAIHLVMMSAGFFMFAAVNNIASRVFLYFKCSEIKTATVVINLLSYYLHFK